jgi:hypothetical protein
MQVPPDGECISDGWRFKNGAANPEIDLRDTAFLNLPLEYLKESLDPAACQAQSAWR